MSKRSARRTRYRRRLHSAELLLDFWLMAADEGHISPQKMTVACWQRFLDDTRAHLAGRSLTNDY